MRALLIRLSHLWLGLRLLPGLLASASQRQLLTEMRLLGRKLPSILKKPIPQAMADLEKMPAKRPFPLPPERQTRDLADLAALLDRRSPLGLCLRRSLLRYRYLNELEVPVVVAFGAKLAPDGSPIKKKLTGHAWLMYGDQPYFEDDENYRGYTVMLRWPDPDVDG